MTMNKKAIKRMKDEYYNLCIKIYKADDYVYSPKKNKSSHPVELLHMQLDAMRKYRDILAIRLQLEGVDSEAIDTLALKDCTMG